MKLPNRLPAPLLPPILVAGLSLAAMLPGCSGGHFARCAEQEAKDGRSQSEDKSASRANKSRHTNRLAGETSPYLRQHAHNPVDWYPWGEEALAKAKRENKVVFLSVGYSSCHWCHVMERESFMDEEIAAYLNEHFVCVKVDREERPDIDKIYMTALQIYNQVSGRGRGAGWPMSMFLTPDGKPFFGGTYFPARDGDRAASTGFLTVIKRVQEIWETRRDKLQQDADALTRIVQGQLDSRPPASDTPLDEKLLDKAMNALEETYDPQYGGFGYDPVYPFQPKFPEPSNLFFLIERLQSQRVSDDDKQRARELLVGTLERMAMGGIRDHLGGGFHRYSVDRYWRIPHFEKMLYDNGQLASVYSAAHLLTGRDDLRRVVDETLSFVLREMTDERGAFYSALDAESEDEEGKFYRWEKKEVQDLLTRQEYELFAPVYGLEDRPNFEGRFYALQLNKPLAELAQSKGMAEGQLEAELAPLRQKLLAARNVRPRPLTDTKILTSWNGLMIRGFADAGRSLKNQRYIDAARRAADFVLSELRTGEGRLLRTYSQGQAKLNAYLDDYAFLVDGLIAIHRAGGEKKWLEAAEELTNMQIQLFWDEAGGGFLFTSHDHQSLIARGRDPVDGAEPSGNSVSAGNLIYLAGQLDRPDYLEKAEGAIRSASGLLDAAPSAAPRLLVALSRLLEQKE